MRLLAALALLAAAPALAADYGEVDGAVLVGCFDGDTCTFDIPAWPEVIGHKIGVRLRGVDTPEIRGKCAAEKRRAAQARDFLSALLLKARVIRLRQLERDKYFRLLATVEADGTDVAQALLGAGHARPYDGGTRSSWCSQ